MSNKTTQFLTSEEAKVELKVQDCNLAHIRNAGKLQFTKKGNAYLYSKEAINKQKKKLLIEKKKSIISRTEYSLNSPQKTRPSAG
jgi:DNA-binding sugar fermentation-stimulating protein